MKLQYKIWSVLLTLALVLTAFVGCENESKNPNATAASTQATLASTNATTVEGVTTQTTSSSTTETTNSNALTEIEFVNGEDLILCVGQTVQMQLELSMEAIDALAWSVSDACIEVSEDGLVTAMRVGTGTVTATLNEFSDTASITVIELVDPYQNVDVTAFYANYTPADSYMDAYFRSLHGLLSGTLAEQDAEPTVAENRPMENGLYLRNTTALYSADGNTYFIVDETGKIVNRIFRGGAYVTLDEVAAYVLAFGDIPANHSSNKRTKPTESIWGKYLRLNHTPFSGSTSKYPYEPELPNISGCGGDLSYYEIDVGTTGTDTGNGYEVREYNDGSKITRGAARIVYTRYDANHDLIIDVNEKYVFYTYNHYNDFQEYLNYEGGWGEMFGNVTGGGTISSKTDCNPTPYVQTVRVAFTYPHAMADSNAQYTLSVLLPLAWCDIRKHA